MKLNITIDCTPAEARAFLGLPDVEAFNAEIMKVMSERIIHNMSQTSPEEIFKLWSGFGSIAQDQYLKMFQAALHPHTTPKTTP